MTLLDRIRRRRPVEPVEPEHEGLPPVQLDPARMLALAELQNRDPEAAEVAVRAYREELAPRFFARRILKHVYSTAAIPSEAQFRALGTARRSALREGFAQMAGDSSQPHWVRRLGIDGLAALREAPSEIYTRNRLGDALRAAHRASTKGATR